MRSIASSSWFPRPSEVCFLTDVSCQLACDAMKLFSFYVDAVDSVCSYSLLGVIIHQPDLYFPEHLGGVSVKSLLETAWLGLGSHYTGSSFDGKILKFQSKTHTILKIHTENLRNICTNDSKCIIQSVQGFKKRNINIGLLWRLCRCLLFAKCLLIWHGGL